MSEPDAIDHYVANSKKKQREVHSARTIPSTRTQARWNNKHLLAVIVCFCLVDVILVLLGSLWHKNETSRLQKDLDMAKNNVVLLQAKLQELHNDKLAEDTNTLIRQSAIHQPAIRAHGVPSSLMPPPMAQAVPDDLAQDPNLKTILDPDAKEWKNRYDYMVIKQKQTAKELKTLQKRYKEVAGYGMNGNTLVTGMQLYKRLISENRQELSDVNKALRNGVNSKDAPYIRAQKEEFESRERWIRRCAQSLKLIQ